jgi:CheY-like chemotaxis protein
MNPPVSEPDAESTSANMHVLVADDDPSVCVLLSLMLGRLGYKVTTVSDGAAAVATVIENLQDIGTVILDVHMPELDGIGAMNRIRSMAPNIRVILTSGTPKADVISDFKPQQPWSFLEKPFHYSEINSLFPQVAAKA